MELKEIHEEFERIVGLGMVPFYENRLKALRQEQIRSEDSRNVDENHLKFLNATIKDIKKKRNKEKKLIKELGIKLYEKWLELKDIRIKQDFESTTVDLKAKEFDLQNGKKEIIFFLNHKDPLEKTISGKSMSSIELARRRKVMSLQSTIDVYVNDKKVETSRTANVSWPKFEAEFGDQFFIYLYTMPKSIELRVNLQKKEICRIPIEIPGTKVEAMTSTYAISKEVKFSRNEYKFKTRLDRDIKKGRHMKKVDIKDDEKVDKEKQKTKGKQDEKKEGEKSEDKKEETKQRPEAAPAVAQPQPPAAAQVKVAEVEIPESIKEGEKERLKRMVQGPDIKGLLYFRSEWKEEGSGMPPAIRLLIERAEKEKKTDKDIPMKKSQLIDVNDPRYEPIIRQHKENNEHLKKLIERDSLHPLHDLHPFRHIQLINQETHYELVNLDIPILEQEVVNDPTLSFLIEKFSKLGALQTYDQMMNEVKSRTSTRDSRLVDKSDEALKRKQKFHEKLKRVQKDIKTGKNKPNINYHSIVREATGFDTKFSLLSSIENIFAPKRKLRPRIKKKASVAISQCPDATIKVQIISGINIPVRSESIQQIELLVKQINESDPSKQQRPQPLPPNRPSEPSRPGELPAPFEQPSNFGRESLPRDDYDRDFDGRRSYKRDPYDRSGYDRNDFERRDYDNRDNDRRDYDRSGYDRRDYDRSGNDRRDYDRRDYDRSGFDRRDYDRSEYDRRGYDRSEYDRRDYDRSEYDRRDYDRSGYDRRDYDRSGYDRSEYDRSRYDRSSYDKGARERDPYGDRLQYEGGSDGRDFRVSYPRDPYNRDPYDRRTSGIGATPNMRGYPNERLNTPVIGGPATDYPRDRPFTGTNRNLRGGFNTGLVDNRFGLTQFGATGRISETMVNRLPGYGSVIDLGYTGNQLAPPDRMNDPSKLGVLQKAKMELTGINKLIKGSVFIEVRYVSSRPGCEIPQVDRTREVSGSFPDWNESLSFKIYPSNGRQLTEEELVKGNDMLYFSIYDKYETENRILMTNKHEITVENKFLGSFSIPLISILQNAPKMDGHIRVNRPLDLQGYGMLPSGMLSTNIFKGEIDTNLLPTYISLSINIDPLLELPAENEFDFYPGAEDPKLLRAGAIWANTHRAVKQGPPKIVKLFGENVERKSILLCRFLTSQAPPKDLIDLENGKKEDEDFAIQTVARFVSLIPFESDNTSFSFVPDMWCTSQEFLDFSRGDYEEHAILLCNYFNYIDGILNPGKVKSYIILGNAVPEGYSTYVMRRNLQNNHVEIWDAVRGQAYFFGKKKETNYCCF